MEIIEQNLVTSPAEFEAKVVGWKRALSGHRMVVLSLGRSSDWAACFCAALASHIQLVLLDPVHKSRVTAARNALPWDLWVSDLGMEARDATHIVELPGYVIFSSGTSGNPKCIHVPFSNLPKVIESQISLLGLCGHTVAWCLSPGFDASISDVLCARWSGGRLVIPDVPFTRLKRLAEVFKANGVQYADIPPRVLELMSPSSFPSLEKILVGGETLAQQAADKWVAHAEVWNSYGPTEATISTSMCRVLTPWTRAWIGNPLPGITYRTSEIGELLIGGNLAVGYMFDEELTRTRFPTIKDPVTGKRVRVFKTGDKVGTDGGRYYFIGRMDTAKKRNGVFIFPEEIEAVARQVGTCKAKWENDELVLECVGETGQFRELIQREMPRWYWPGEYREIENVEVSANGKSL